MSIDSIFLIFSLSLLTNILVIFFFGYLSKKINVYDVPNSDRKFHKKKTPLLGGPIVCVNLLLILLILSINHFFIKNEDFSNLNNYGLRDFFSFIVMGIVIFLIGFYDDKHNLDPFKKIFLLFIALYVSIGLDNELIIHYLDLNIFSVNIFFGSQSGLILSIFCFLILINSLNLFDGVNMQSSGIFIFIYSIFIINGLYLDVTIILLLANLNFFYLNFKEKCFYGDSGIYINSYFIGYILIKSYNLNQGLSPESIFLLFILPCVDMLRIFFIRIIKKKNPFKGDRNHFHHLLKNKIKNNNVLAFAIFIFGVSPYFLFDQLDFNFFKILILFLIIYSITIYLSRNEKK